MKGVGGPVLRRDAVTWAGRKAGMIWVKGQGHGSKPKVCREM